nr:MAG TPA: hypothetical protein [Caudoviricetes sp.]
MQSMLKECSNEMTEFSVTCGRAQVKGEAGG